MQTESRSHCELQTLLGARLMWCARAVAATALPGMHMCNTLCAASLLLRVRLAF